MNFRSQSKMKAVTFSYDDGIMQDIRFIELLNKYGLKCTFNLNSELLSNKETVIREGKNIVRDKISAANLKHVYAGHEVAVHTLTHPNLTDCDDSEVIRQVETDRCNLSDLVGYEVVGMAYPCGGVNNNEHVANLIKNHTGVQYSRTITTNDSFDLQENLYRFNPTVFHLDFDKMMQLGQEFIELKPETPKIFYIWGHTYEFDFRDYYWDKIEEFLKLISNHDDIFYGTNKEILL